MRPGELDLFEGSPPCASFSAAGAGEKDWGKTKKYSDSEQRTDDLFYEWVRLLEGLRPRAFIAENVPGMINGNALSEYAHKITAELSKLGYRVSAKVLNAANYGVPQERERLIFVGIRNDVQDDGPAWEYPPPTTPVPAPTQSLPRAGARGRAEPVPGGRRGLLDGGEGRRPDVARVPGRVRGRAHPAGLREAAVRALREDGRARRHMEGEGDDAVPVGGPPENGHTVQKWSKEGLP
jgi:site-specific DNA-cytosine methylase